jgi:UDP-galactopyranose mutase
MFEQRDHIAGNIYTEVQSGIIVHKMGSHIFHTNNDEVFYYLSQFTEFHNYEHKVIADTGKDVVTMPFNLQTMSQIFGTTKVEDIKYLMQKEIREYCRTNNVDAENPQNFEEQAIVLVGTSIYEQLIKGYTKKQWGRDPKALPAEIIKRLPIRWNLDMTYFNNAKHQGIPKHGYTKMIEEMLEGDYYHLIHKKFTIDMLEDIPEDITIIYTGGLDELLNYELGLLEYRSLEFIENEYSFDTYQGCAVVNYTSEDVEFTRITEHKFYMTEEDRPKGHTITSTEYSMEHDITKGTIPYYPIGDAANKQLHQEYVEQLKKFKHKIIPVGRLATYQYLDMDKTVELAIEVFKDNF